MLRSVTPETRHWHKSQRVAAHVLLVWWYALLMARLALEFGLAEDGGGH